jgi:ABC-type antimicrobial peptide transport system permease subunit
VARRTREIGIRMALGGTSSNVLRHVMGGTLGFVAIGLVLGLALSVALGRVLKIFLFGISPLDPTAYVAVCVLFAGVALFASYLPARRAARVDPLIALREE